MNARIRMDGAPDPAAPTAVEPLSASLIAPDKPPLGNLVAYRLEPGGADWQAEAWERVLAEIESTAAIEFYAPDGEVNLVIDPAAGLPDGALGVMRAEPHAPRVVAMSDGIDFRPWYEAVAAHELMHALGFGHVSPDVDSLMQPRIGPLSGGLTELDRASLSALYPEPEDFAERKAAARWAEFHATREAWERGEASYADALDDAQAHAQAVAGAADAFVFLEDYGLAA